MKNINAQFKSLLKKLYREQREVNAQVKKVETFLGVQTEEKRQYTKKRRVVRRARISHWTSARRKAQSEMMKARHAKMVAAAK